MPSKQPLRVPERIILIIICIALSSLGYVLAVARFGGAVRTAAASTGQIADLREEMLDGIDQRIDRAADQRMAALGDVQRLFEGYRKERVEAEASLQERIAALEAQLGAIALGQPVVASGSVGPDSLSESGGALPLAASLAMPTLVDVRGGIRIELLSARTRAELLICELAVTKVTPGDGVFSIPDQGIDTARAVLADGTQYEKLQVGLPDAYRNRNFRSNLIAGTPIRLTAYFTTAKRPAPRGPLACRRIEFRAYGDEKAAEPLLFRFENLPVPE